MRSNYQGRVPHPAPCLAKLPTFNWAHVTIAANVRCLEQPDALDKLLTQSPR